MSTDVVGLRALAESLDRKYEFYRRMNSDGDEHETMILLRTAAAAIREVLPALDEITTLRAEVADRDARIEAALAVGQTPGQTTSAQNREVAMRRILSAPAVPVPQDNPEAARSDIADEISGVQVGHGYESTTIGIAAALEAADLIKAAFDVRPKNGEKP